jgi:ABC-type cobalamin transport system permease subunit
MPLDQAVIDAGVVRFRPMLLTAAAVIVGTSVILSDPIFQGLAVPVLYYVANARSKNTNATQSDLQSGASL